MELLANLIQYLFWGVAGLALFTQSVEQSVSPKKRLACGAVYGAAFGAALYFGGYISGGFGLLPFLLLAAPVLCRVWGLEPVYGVTRLLICHGYVAAMQFAALAVLPRNPWAPPHRAQILAALAAGLACFLLYRSKHLLRYRFVKKPGRAARVLPAALLFLFSIGYRPPALEYFWPASGLLLAACALCLAAGGLFYRATAGLPLLREVQKALKEPSPERYMSWDFPCEVLDILEEGRDKRWSAAQTVKKMNAEEKMFHAAYAYLEKGKGADPGTGFCRLDWRLINIERILGGANVDFTVKTAKRMAPRYLGGLSAHHVLDLMVAVIGHAWAAIQLGGNTRRGRIEVALGLAESESGPWYEIRVIDNGIQRDRAFYGTGMGRGQLRELLAILNRGNASLSVGSRPPMEGEATTKVAVRFDGRGRLRLDEFDE